MSFGNFLRRLSTDSENTAEQMSGESSGINALLAAPGKLIETVNTKTGHIVSDLNQKLDLGGKIGSIKQASVSTFESVVHATTSSVSSGKEPDSADRTESTETDCAPGGLRRQSTTPRPPRPPLPTAAALHRAMSLDESNLSGGLLKEQRSIKRTIRATKLEPYHELDEEGQRIHGGSEEIENEGDSSASEYGTLGDNPIYEGDVTGHTPGVTGLKKPESELSQSDSANVFPDRAVLVMDECVPALLQARWGEMERYESELQELLGTSPGRMAFVNKVEQESTKAKGALESHAIKPLLEKINYLLTECQDAEDFAPARKLLTTSLLYYVNDPTMPTDRTFLFAYIKSSPIWQSLRFWNACFFQSVQEAKAKLAEQSQSYLNTMNVFDLHDTIKQEFLRKHSSLFNLSDGDMLTTMLNSKLSSVVNRAYHAAEIRVYFI